MADPVHETFTHPEFITKWNELYGFLDDITKVAEETERRHKELVRAHTDGWKHVADALSGGLRLIADAIRDHGRR
jgi:hypothetical protein